MELRKKRPSLMATSFLFCTIVNIAFSKFTGFYERTATFLFVAVIRKSAKKSTELFPPVAPVKPDPW
jgi:hypothetical protein